MNILRRLFGLGDRDENRPRQLGTGLRCARCSRPVEEGEKPMGAIGEWYNEWVPQGWWETSLLKCATCGRVYCSDCVPRFMQFVVGPEFAPDKCCDKPNLEMIRGRQKGSFV